ncbi:MAG: DUF4911 domain-containing protein [Candidatus Cloacimonetes bacterium]|nr:DUF4911 domain-containing protein [Candidatus Cloacimonadota bacterium]MBL7107819.1 DUF4911 domain-containing protein [Candidatus Cloacimonadota bacterium]
MQIQKISEKIQSDNSSEVIIKTNGMDLQILGYILETFEGYCNYTTIDKKNMKVKITIPKDFRSEIKKILKYLQNF